MKKLMFALFLATLTFVYLVVLIGTAYALWTVFGWPTVIGALILIVALVVLFYDVNEIEPKYAGDGLGKSDI